MEGPEETEEMKRFERETGKKAVWRGVITETFKKWQKGEKIYTRNKDRLGIYLSNEDKKFWQELANNKGKVTLSQMIRDAVKHYAECDTTNTSRISNEFIHEIRSPLTALKGYADILLKFHNENLDSSMQKRVQGIIDKSDEINKILVDHYEKVVKLEGPYVTKKNNLMQSGQECDILIIDDDSDTREFLVDFLKFMKYKCQVLTDGSNIIEKLDAIQPHVVLLDVYLPIINGIDVCKKIRANKNYKDLPVYFITAAPESDVKQFVKQVEVTGYFIKPFEVKYLEKLKQHIPQNS